MRFYEDFEVGASREIGSHEVTREEIIDFATKWDPRPFHIDEKAAARSVFGSLTASSCHTYALTGRITFESGNDVAAAANLKTELLSELELATVGPVIKKFRSEASEAAYRSGTTLRSSGRKSDAVVSFRTSLAVAPTGRFSNQARYLLGITLRESRLYKDAIEVFEEIRSVEKDKAVLEAAFFHQFDRLLEVFLGLATKANDEIAGDGSVGQPLVNPLHHVAIVFDRVAALHSFQHSIGSAL